MKRSNTTLLATLASAAIIGSADAATLVNYEFTGASPAQTSGDLSGSDVTHGAYTGNGGASTRGFSSSTNSIFVRWNATGALAADGDTLAEAIANEAYATFTVTNTTATAYDLTNLTFDIFFDPYDTVTTTSVFVMTDLSGFTDGDELGGVTYAPGAGPGPSDTPDTITVDFSSLGNLSAGASFESRLYFVDDADTADKIFRVDNVTVNGDVVPEPGSLALLGLGGLCVLRRRRG